MSLTSLPTVRFAIITPALLDIMAALVDSSRAWIVTSGSDGTHLPNSKHYSGEALDLRSHDLDGLHKQYWRDKLEAGLGPAYTVLLEDLNGENEHFHIQTKRT